MSLFHALGLVIAMGLGLYLGFALLFPEKMG
ncbi:MAG: potassium-transporting ATPase subunit F [Deltaproteobacteria bacterium]|nr:potassium-transporting ATPase subunit F [Deltaproteobacteria bacterium]